MEKEQTFYQELKAKGYTRRQFLKFCGIMGAMLGLHQTGIAQVVNALQTKPRKPVLWFHFQECTCCSESFLRSSHPLVGQILLEMISLDYSDTLMAASGFQAEEVRTRSMKENWGKYIMIVEGSIPLGNPGYCTIAGHSAKQVFDEAAHGASAIIAWGNCASSGCIQGAYPNPTDTKPVHKIISGKPVINVQGCPPIADVMAGVITYILTFDRLPELDNMGRPVSFYGRRIHDTCYRRPAYDAGLFVEAFDDENAKKGYCLYKMGCKGPNTFNSCAVIKWNEGVSYPIQSGHGCIGCAEPGFWDAEPMYHHLPDIKGFGIEATADQIGLGLTAVAAAGVPAHAIVTNIQKRKLIKNQMDNDDIDKEEFAVEEHQIEREEKRLDQKAHKLEKDKDNR